MLNPELINKLAGLNNMSDAYLDWAGNPVSVPAEKKVPMLEAMGFDMSSDLSVEKAIESTIEQQWANVLPPVVVLHQNSPFEIEVCLDAEKAPETLELALKEESGETTKFKFPLKSLKEAGRRSTANADKIKVLIALPEETALGYHTLKVLNKGLKSECSLIVAPETCFEPQEILDGKKIWGSSLQLYSVRSERNWGMGDYSDLKTLGTELGKTGADVIGLNPIHALYQDNPLHCSPYSPSSRTYGNVLYIDPETVPEFAECKKAQTLFADEQFQERLSQVRAEDYIDYAGSASLKFSVLEALFKHFSNKHLKKDTPRAKAFRQFCKDRGESLHRFTLFDALFEHFRKQDMMNWGWPCWPEEYQTPDTKAVATFAKKNADRIEYFKYLQWLAEAQIAEAQKAAKDAGMLIGIYRDLAVGVDRGGADVWADRSLYVLDASTGAPPDGLGPQGQNWGLPPFHPQVLQEKRYLPFIDMIRSNMRDCGALRIDHAMGLFRLWWCPNGKGAADGAYIHYPLQDMLGIIKLESRRNGCLVFGEDLGTVPKEITESLPPARFYSSVLGIFNQIGDHYVLPQDFKQKALATLVCHDTPTLAGWWIGKDIDLAEELGIFTPERAAQEREGRHPSRQAIINTLRMINELPHDSGDSVPTLFSRQLMERLSYYLTLSASQITGVQLEDCMLIDTPVNIPGTSDEYPNWRRRLTENLESFFGKEENLAFFRNLTGCRGA